MIQLRYFASVRERLGLASEELALPPAVDNVEALLAHLARERGVGWQAVLQESPLLVAVNQTMAGKSAGIRDGDEVAFFPPVTGG